MALVTVCHSDNICKRSACQWDSGESRPLLRLHYSSLCGPRPYRLAVCPLASSLCLPTWRAFSSGNKGGVQFWAMLGSSYPTPTPFSRPGASRPPSFPPVLGRPLGSERPFPTVPGKRQAELFGWHPLFLTLWLPFLSPTRPLKLHLSRLKAAPLPIVWPGFGSSGFHSNPWAFN